MAVVCHFGYVGQILGWLTNSIWWSLSLYKILSESLKSFWLYRSLNILSIWPIYTPFWTVFWGKNRGKWKLSAFLSLWECSNPQLISYEANCIKISSTGSEKKERKGKQKKTTRERYLTHTPQCPQWGDCFTFGMWGVIADIITHAKFFVHLDPRQVVEYAVKFVSALKFKHTDLNKMTAHHAKYRYILNTVYRLFITHIFTLHC